MSIFALIWQDIGFAQGFFSKNNQEGATLAPPLALNKDEKGLSVLGSLIIKEIDRRARAEGGLTLDLLRRWALQLPDGEAFSKAIFHIYGNECHVLVDNDLLIRYFPAEQKLMDFLFEKGRDRLVSEADISPSMRRQIYRMTPSPRSNRTIFDVFDHIIEKTEEPAMQRAVSVSAASYEVKPEQWPTCRIWPDGRLELHTEFIMDFNDIKRSGMGIAYAFDSEQVRWLNIAESIAYRAAMHEFKMPRRTGHGHAYIDADGRFRISRSEAKANIVGRRYSVVDDAAWLWYLHSYKMNDEIRYEKFKERIDWIFSGADAKSREAARRFPNLKVPKKPGRLRDEALRRRREAIRLALLINREFFINRSKAGIDTTPAYEKRIDVRPAEAPLVVKTAPSRRPSSASGKDSSRLAGPEFKYHDELKGAISRLYSIEGEKGQKDIMRAVLSRFELSPPLAAEVFSRDRFGFPMRDVDMENIIKDPAAFFYHACAYLIKSGDMAIEAAANKRLSILVDGAQLVLTDLDISEGSLIEGEEWLDQDQWNSPVGLAAVKGEGYRRKREYYYLRILLKKIFREEGRAFVKNHLDIFYSGRPERAIYKGADIVVDRETGGFKWQTHSGSGDKTLDGQHSTGLVVTAITKKVPLDAGVIVCKGTTGGNITINRLKRQGIVVEDQDRADRYVALVVTGDGSPYRLFEGLEDGGGKLTLIHDFSLREVSVYKGAELSGPQQPGGLYSHSQEEETRGTHKYFSKKHLRDTGDGVVCAEVNDDGYLCLAGEVILFDPGSRCQKMALEVKKGRFTRLFRETGKEPSGAHLFELIGDVEELKKRNAEGRSGRKKYVNGNGRNRGQDEDNPNFIKGRIFEELVLRLFRAVFGEKVEFEKEFEISRLLKEYRYPDYFIREPGETSGLPVIIADAKWGRSDLNIMRTIQKYSRLMVKEGYDKASLWIAVADAALVNEIKGEVESASSENINVEIMTVDELVKKLHYIGGEKKWGALEAAHQYLAQTIGKEFRTLLEMSASGNIKERAAAIDELKKILESVRVLNGEREKHEPKESIPVIEIEEWQPYLDEHFLPRARSDAEGKFDILMGELESLKRIHDPYWERSYHDTCMVYLSYILERLGDAEGFDTRQRSRIRLAITAIGNNYPGHPILSATWHQIVERHRKMQDAAKNGVHAHNGSVNGASSGKNGVARLQPYYGGQDAPATRTAKTDITPVGGSKKTTALSAPAASTTEEARPALHTSAVEATVTAKSADENKPPRENMTTGILVDENFLGDGTAASLPKNTGSSITLEQVPHDREGGFFAKPAPGYVRPITDEMIRRISHMIKEAGLDWILERHLRYNRAKALDAEKTLPLFSKRFVSVSITENALFNKATLTFNDIERNEYNEMCKTHTEVYLRENQQDADIARGMTQGSPEESLLVKKMLRFHILGAVSRLVAKAITFKAAKGDATARELIETGAKMAKAAGVHASSKIEASELIIENLLPLYIDKTLYKPNSQRRLPDQEIFLRSVITLLQTDSLLGANTLCFDQSTYDKTDVKFALGEEAPPHESAVTGLLVDESFMGDKATVKLPGSAGSDPIEIEPVPYYKNGGYFADPEPGHIRPVTDDMIKKASDKVKGVGLGWLLQKHLRYGRGRRSLAWSGAPISSELHEPVPGTNTARLKFVLIFDDVEEHAYDVISKAQLEEIYKNSGMQFNPQEREILANNIQYFNTLAGICNLAGRVVTLRAESGDAAAQQLIEIGARVMEKSGPREISKVAASEEIITTLMPLYIDDMIFPPSKKMMSHDEKQFIKQVMALLEKESQRGDEALCFNLAARQDPNAAPAAAAEAPRMRPAMEAAGKSRFQKGGSQSGVLFELIPSEVEAQRFGTVRVVNDAVLRLVERILHDKGCSILTENLVTYSRLLIAPSSQRMAQPVFEASGFLDEGKKYDSGFPIEIGVFDYPSESFKDSFFDFLRNEYSPSELLSKAQLASKKVKVRDRKKPKGLYWDAFSIPERRAVEDRARELSSGFNRGVDLRSNPKNAEMIYVYEFLAPIGSAMADALKKARDTDPDADRILRRAAELKKIRAEHGKFNRSFYSNLLSELELKACLKASAPTDITERFAWNCQKGYISDIFALYAGADHTCTYAMGDRLLAGEDELMRDAIALLQKWHREGKYFFSNNPIAKQPVEALPGSTLSASASGRDNSRLAGPGSPGYKERGGQDRVRIENYIDMNRDFLKRELSVERAPVLVRIPVEALEAAGEVNARNFISTLLKSPRVTIELYTVAPGLKVNDETYRHYGAERRAFLPGRNRSNTITLFAAAKDEPLLPQDLSGKTGDCLLRPDDTILVPVGLKTGGKDPSGLVRGVILGLRLSRIASGRAGDDFIRETVEQVRTFAVIFADALDEVDITKDDILALAKGSVNEIAAALKKLIKLLPIAPIDAENLRRIYEHAKEVLEAA